MTTISADQSDDALLAELTGAPQRWFALCRNAVAQGPRATGALLEPRRETAVLARQSLARWKNFGAGEDPLEEESEEPDLQGRRVTADVSAAYAVASLAQALTGVLDPESACAAFLDHAERAGLLSVGTQLLPAGPLTAEDNPLSAVVLHLLGQGGRPARGFGILAALELAGQRAATVRSAQVSVLFVNITGGGEVGVLRLEQLRSGPSGLHPDPARMSFLQADRAFTDSLERAWRISAPASTGACVLWSVSGVGGAPANDINGESMGAAIAVALDDLAPRRRWLRGLRPRTLDPTCAVTAGLSGTVLTTVGGYTGKLVAAQRASLRVVVADEGYDQAVEEAPRNYTDRISAARTVTEAIGEARTRANVALWLVSSAGLLAVLLAVVSATDLARTRIENAAARAESDSRLFAGVARGNAGFDPALSQLIALAAYRTRATEDARSALLEMSAAGVPLRVTPGDGLGRGAAGGPQAPRLATTADGDLIAIGESDGTLDLVRVTDAGVRRLPRIPTGSGPIGGLALSADQRLLVVAGDHESALWDITDAGNPRIAARLELGGHLPRSAAFSPDRRVLAIGAHGGAVLSWRLGDDPARPVAMPTVVVPGYQAEVAVSDRALVTAVRTVPSGSGWKSIVRGWDTSTFDRDQTPAFDILLERPQGSEARSVDFSVDGSVLTVGLNPGEVARWRIGDDLTRPEPLPSMSRGPNEYFDVSPDRDGRTAAIVGGDSRARIVDLATGDELAGFQSGIVARAAFLRGGRALVTSGADHAVHVFDLPGPTTTTGTMTLFGLPQDRADPDAAVLPTTLFPRLAALSRAPAGGDHHLADGDPAGLVDTVVLAPDGTRAATLNERVIQVWDLGDPLVPRPLGAPISNSLVDVRGMTFAPDGTLAIGRGLTESVEFWDVSGPAEPRLRAGLRFGRGYPTALSFSPDGRMLAVGSHRTGNAGVYDLDDPGTPIAELSGLRPDGLDMSLALSSRDLLAVGAPSGIQVYELGEPGTPPRRLPVPPGVDGAVGALAFHHDGVRLAVDDILGGSIALWDYTDPDRPTGYATIARSRHWQKTIISFAAGGTVLAESAVDGTLRRWRTDVEAEARRICASGTAPITAEEWARALPGHHYVDPCPES
ncbi:WD40 repeat domain-containing protein [Nocardia shimofusensis]|uniref:WD40 repeat domain-containing protein n=1 Tax=Nocardia shimofusensis TaxID=228596 RepID=UPI00082A3D4D|nr:WD40 repeat domain-containing protein [Nocardia shimofusensis]